MLTEIMPILILTFIFYSTFWLVIYFKYNSVYSPKLTVSQSQTHNSESHNCESQTHNLSIPLPAIMVTTSSFSKSVGLLLIFERVEKEEVTWTPVSTM